MYVEHAIRKFENRKTLNLQSISSNLKHAYISSIPMTYFSLDNVWECENSMPSKKLSDYDVHPLVFRAVTNFSSRRGIVKSSWGTKKSLVLRLQAAAGGGGGGVRWRLRV